MPDGKEGYAFYRVSAAQKPLPMGEVALRSNDGARHERAAAQRWAGSLSARNERCTCASPPAALPSQALRASSPKGRAFGRPVKFPLDAQSLFVSWTVVPCCLGQRQLDKVRCPEAAALCSKARPFTSYRAFSGQAKVARPAKGSPFGGAGERSETERAGLQKKLFMNAISLAARAGTASSRRTGRTGWGRVRSISKPPL